MKSAQYYIDKLNMTPHVEGGYFKESVISEDLFREDKRLFSSIYFLLETGEVSNFHRLTSDEMWYYHDGQALTIYMIMPDGELITKQLGLDIEKGEVPQVLVPKGYIFGSSMNNDGFALVGCMVAPQFTFDEFELFDRKKLLNLYPNHGEIIKKLTR
ncbi:cupin domain-containing protein [Metaclostridioides mangenotii]|uniref:Cupin superfamily sugar epimerase n=1 Tax=Metaclostridioides mangenotii TaxID=1540 RepID=A0ABS4EB39_9FIRM|nr:cupin domain-containing protein [Clostridioides mangenotii]MBP1855150.1 putative cupin superfamily sugar epimerase [Clostridioides mangenotii]